MLNPMKQIRVSASTPPARATGTTPSRTRSAAIASDAAPELQAVTTVSRGPPMPSTLPTTSTCEDGKHDARARGSGAAPPRARCQYQASASSIPPPTAPTISAVSPRSARPIPASSIASRAAARANRSARDRRAEPPSESGTSAPIRQRKPSVSIRVIGRIAQTPPLIPSQYALTPAPNGLTTPRPVTATGFTRRLSSTR